MAILRLASGLEIRNNRVLVSGPLGGGQMTSVSRLTTTEGRRITARGRRLAELAGAVASISLLLAGMASTQASAGAPTATAARPGNWIRLGLSQNAPAAVWRAPDAR